MVWEQERLHFTGVGGIGMSGLAELCLKAGCRVSGSDARLSAVTARLSQLGVTVTEGHAASNVPADATALIVSSAVKAANPEVVEAQRRGIAVVRRGELLAELMRQARGVALGGSHGKTTTSSMAALVAIEAGLDPTVFVGTLVPFLDGSNVRRGGDLFITECDESDGSFLELSPLYSVITNIDREHLDYYGTFENARSAFAQFANRVAFHGALICCTDCAEVRALLPRVRRRVISYGHAEDATLRITGEQCDESGSRFRLIRNGVDLGEFRLHVLGAHNVLNAAAVAAVMLELGLSAEQIRHGLAAYRGTGRRMEPRGAAAGVTLMDDYGHHPTEVRATLEALRLRRPGRLVVLFQPHRYTRTGLLMEEFTHAFDSADVVRLIDIYAASEAPIAGVTAEALAERVAGAGHRDCRYLGSLEAAVAALPGELRPGDLVLTLGAGSVTQAGSQILEALERGSVHG